MKKVLNKYPPGLNAAKVKRIVEYYDNQSDDEAAVEIERATEVAGAVWMKIPGQLVPKVQRLIAARKKSA